jgi:hypothetical protein
MTQERQHAYRGEPFPFSGNTQREFETALEGASARTARSIFELRQATRACVRQLKAGGMTPEGVIITMRAYLRFTAQTHVPMPGPGETSVTLDILGDHLANWCIDEYYLT